MTDWGTVQLFALTGFVAAVVIIGAVLLFIEDNK